MSDKKPAEQATQPETGAPSAPPSTDSVRAADQPVTAAAAAPISADAPTTVPPAIAAAQAPKANAVIRGKVPTVPADAPLYRARKVHFLNGRIVEKGEQVRFAGVPGSGLEPLDEAAKEASEAAAKERAAKAAEAEKLRIDRNKLIKALKSM